MSEANNNVPAATPEISPQAPQTGASSQILEANNNPTGPVAEGQDHNAQEAVEEHKAEIAKKIKKLKLKVDGKEFDEELPFEIDDTPEAVEYMRRELQLARMGQKRANESSEYKKQLDAVGKYISELKETPAKFREFMKELGADEKAIAAAIIEEEIERSKKSPEQLEKEKVEAELRALREEREKEKKEFEGREFERLQKQETERYDTMISTAIEKSDLPKSPYVVKKFAEYMLLSLQEGKDLTAEELLPLVREEIQSDVRQMFAAMPEEVIESVIGKDTLKRLRKRNIAQAAPVPVSKSVKDTAASKQSDTKSTDKKVSFRDYFKM